MKDFMEWVKNEYELKMKDYGVSTCTNIKYLYLLYKHMTILKINICSLKKNLIIIIISPKIIHIT